MASAERAPPRAGHPRHGPRPGPGRDGCPGRTERAGVAGRRPLDPGRRDGRGRRHGHPQTGGTAVIVTDGDPTTLNVATTTSNTPSDIGAKIFDGLVWLDPGTAPSSPSPPWPPPGRSRPTA